MHAGLVDATARGMSKTDGLAAPWPALAGALRRAIAGILAPASTWSARWRERSPRLRVSDEWLAEYRVRSSKHEEQI